MFKAIIMKLVFDCWFRMKVAMWNKIYDPQVFNFLELGIRKVMSCTVTKCQRKAPPAGCESCDVAARGNPGNAGFGIILRYQSC